MQFEAIKITRPPRPERTDPSEAQDLSDAYAERRQALQVISDSVDSHASREITTDVSKAEVASASAEDTGSSQLGAGNASLIKPIYDPVFLTKTIEGSSELGQVVRAMVANTVLYGYRLVARSDEEAERREADRKAAAIAEAAELGEEPKAPKPTPEDLARAERLLNERIEFENFARYAGDGVSLLRVLEELAWDFYLTGNAWAEITRSESGDIVGIYRIPSYTMNLSKLEAKPFTAEMKSIRRTRDGYVVRNRYEQKRFRRYAQINRGTVSAFGGGRGIHVWFKEFQDPREYDRQTGELIKNKRSIKKQRRLGNLANEMVHISSPTTRGPYGFPYYIGNLVSIAADITIDNTNLSTLENNMIPSMVVTVSGNASLTKGSWKRLTEFTRSKFIGKDNRSRFLVLEAQPAGEIDEDNGNIQVGIKSLHDTQKNDQMFQDYSENARASIRRAFRLPEILVGRGEAAGGVVVAASMKLADEQVFAQDRDLFVDWINRRLLPEMGISGHELQLNSPNATDPDTLVRLLQAAERTGALTPAISRMIMERILSTKFADFPADFRSDVPFTLTMAQAVKKVNDSGANNPTGETEPETTSNGADPKEPGQTVTAAIGNADADSG